MGMQARRLKLAVVLGRVDDYGMMTQFEAIQDQCDVHVYVSASERWIQALRTGLKVHVFEEVPDMPGYMRGLEEHLKDFDAVICNEASRLSTFQATRHASKREIPVAVMTSEFHPYHYLQWSNIRAVQQDVFKSATQHWAMSGASLAMLRAEGVDESQLIRSPLVLDTDKFQFQPHLRLKFREYIGISKDEFVITYMAPLETEYRPSELLQAVKLLANVHPDVMQRLRIIYVGEGSMARDLKYRVHDLGLVRNVLLLQQDPAPFIRDLYSATDVLVQPRWEGREHHEPLPRRVLEAAACGVIPIVPGQTVYREMLGEIGQYYDEFQFQHIFALLNAIVKDGGGQESRRVSTANWIHQEYPLASSRLEFSGLVNRLLSLRDQDTGHRLTTSEELELISDRVRSGQSAVALAQVEQLLERIDASEVREMAEAWRIKGDALLSIGNLEDATDAFSRSIQIDRGNFTAYKGLAQIAYRGHSHDEAVSFYKKALARQACDADSLVGLGMVYRRLGLFEQSLYWLERGVYARPDDDKVMAMLLKICLETNVPKTAIAVLERLQDTQGAKPDLELTLGRLHLAAGDAKIGAELVERALSKTVKPTT